MSTLPKINGSGTLTADPELRFIQSGTAVVSINLAVNNRVYNKDTKQYEDGESTFLRASAWKQLAENIGENLTKGQRVVFTGTLKQKNWEDKEGNKRSSFEVQLDDIGPSLMFGGKKKAEDPWSASTGSSSW
jgi:single-strand DNA-binding protein